MSDAPAAPEAEAPAEEAAEPVEGTVVEPGSEEGGELVRRAQEIVVSTPQQQRPDYKLAMEMGRQMAASGYFGDAKEEAQAAVKMIIGLDLGISPTAAMSAI